MSQETLQSNPVQEAGLSPEQAQTAVDLRQNIGEKAAALAGLEHDMTNRSTTGFMTGDRVSGPSVTQSIEDDVNHVVKQHQVNKAQRAAKKHFKQNEGAYQEQAVKEATEAGVELNGWEQEQNPKQEAVNVVAGALHEDWRKTRKQEDGSFEPRVKTTKDEAYIKAHGTDQVDIANSTYGELPSDWQAENKAAAETVVGILDEHHGQIDLTNKESREQVGSRIHDAWLSRNPWAKGGELDVPFAELPEAEQAKDIDQMTIALGTLESDSKPGAKPEPELSPAYVERYARESNPFYNPYKDGPRNPEETAMIEASERKQDRPPELIL